MVLQIRCIHAPGRQAIGRVPGVRWRTTAAEAGNPLRFPPRLAKLHHQNHSWDTLGDISGRGQVQVNLARVTELLQRVNAAGHCYHGRLCPSLDNKSHRLSCAVFHQRPVKRGRSRTARIHDAPPVFLPWPRSTTHHAHELEFAPIRPRYKFQRGVGRAQC